MPPKHDSLVFAVNCYDALLSPAPNPPKLTAFDACAGRKKGV